MSSCNIFRLVREQPESQRVTMQRETRSNSLASQYAHTVSNSGNIGPLYSSPFGFHSDAPFSSVFPRERHNEGTSFVTQPMNAGVYLPSAAYFSFSGTLQVPTNSFSKDSAEMPWYSDLAQSILNYSDDITTGDNEFESSLIVASDEYMNKQNAWNNAMNDNWNELFVDSSATESQAKSLLPDVYQAEQSPSGIQVRQPQNHQLVSCHSGELSAVPSSLLATTAATKPRMRWTPELHERFLDAVNQLGGSEKATPKGVLNIMKVEGLTICHVKSHLQKFRTARCMSDSPGMPGKKDIECEELPSLNLKTGIDLTEAFSIQMEVQKQLHAQLEIQKKLQLQIEKQEKFLQMIIEKQCKPATMVHASSTREESTADKTDYTKKSEQPPEENSTNGSSVREDRKVGDKWRMPESEQLDSCGTNAMLGSPSPLKHARINDDIDA